MILDSLLPTLEKSALGAFVRELGSWAYAFINLFHVVSVILLVGAIIILDLRFIGWRRHISLDNVSAVTLPIARIGFVGAVFSGICMLSVNASEYSGNPFLLIKFVALFFALINIFFVTYVFSWRSQSIHQSDRNKRLFAIFGIVSLICWLTVVGAGRLIAYW